MTGSIERMNANTPYIWRKPDSLARIIFETLLAWLGRFLWWIGSFRPYWDLHHLHALYMRRRWLLGGSNPKWDDRVWGEYDDYATRSWKSGAIDRFIGRFFAIRLHVICTPDDYRELHDHPFAFCSLILCGGYTELMPKDPEQHPRFDKTWYRLVRRRAGSISFRRQANRHAIFQLLDGRPVLTACLMWGKCQRWGFFSESGKIPPKIYRWLERAISYEELPT